MDSPVEVRKGRFSVWGPASHIGMLAAALVFVADQAFKTWVLHAYDLANRGVVEVLPFFNLVMVWNTGISYGLLTQDSELGRWLLVIFKLGASIGLVFWLARTHVGFAALSIGLVIGGALGNALDRVLYGAVADFFSLHAFGYYWYVFNIADVAIVAGVAGLLWDSFRPSLT